MVAAQRRGLQMYRLNRMARHMEPVAAKAAAAAPQKILKGMKVVELATVVAVRTPTPARARCCCAC